MARKTTISKEIILDSALKMLIRDGYSSINIKTLAAEIGCSTQPIVWHFKNMESFRKALALYALEYSKPKRKPKDAIKQFENLGMSFIKMAVREPNLFRFLYLDISPNVKPYKLNDFSLRIDEDNMISRIAEQTGLSESKAASCIQNTIVYSHGLATMIATGILKISEKKAMSMIKKASETFVTGERLNQNEK